MIFQKILSNLEIQIQLSIFQKITIIFNLFQIIKAIEFQDQIIFMMLLIQGQIF